MELYKIGSILLDISIGLLLLGTIIRLILTLRYFKRNGVRTLTAAQITTIKRIRIPIYIVSIVLAIASIVFLLL